MHPRTPPLVSQKPIARRMSGLVGWWSAGHLAQADGAAVPTWNDLSGSGFDVAQATGGKQPTFRQQATLGRPSVDFDGGDSLARASATVASGDYTLIVAGHFLNASGGGTYVMDTETGRLVLAYGGGGSTSNLYYDGAWHTIGSLGGIDYNAVITWRLWNAVNGEVRKNGRTIGTDTYTQKAFGNRLAIGSSYDETGAFLDGELFEVALWNRPLSNGELAQVEWSWVRRYLGGAAEF